MLAPYHDERWVTLFNDVLEAGHELEDERINDYRGRYFNFSYMVERAEHYLAQKPSAYWLEACAKADIPAAPVNDFPDLQKDPHLEATGFFKRREHPTEGGYWETQPPVRFHGLPEKDIRPAPTIGQDTELVLMELGLGSKPRPFARSAELCARPLGRLRRLVPLPRSGGGGAVRNFWSSNPQTRGTLPLHRPTFVSRSRHSPGSCHPASPSRHKFESPGRPESAHARAPQETA